jgi:hypothetical protein
VPAARAERQRAERDRRDAQPGAAKETVLERVIGNGGKPATWSALRLKTRLDLERAPGVIIVT